MNKYRVIFLASVLFSLNIISMDNYSKELSRTVKAAEKENKRIEEKREPRLRTLEEEHSPSQDQKGKNAMFENEMLMWRTISRREKEEVKK